MLTEKENKACDNQADNLVVRRRFVASLSPTLFWDVNREEIDAETHRRFIISRVLERGNLSDWAETKAHYTLPVIVDEAQQMRSLEPKALAFIACVGKVPVESFRCYTLRQSHQRHWLY